MRAIVFTVGTSRRESLGALKLANWLRRQGHYVVEELVQDELSPLFLAGFDLFCFSVVFSEHLPKLAAMANEAKYWGEVWIGGPAVTFHPKNTEYIFRQTGIRPTVGLDSRFEQEPGRYPMTYFSRGCPAYSPACGNCPVPAIEGNKFTMYPDAACAPLLLDNNLSALPVDFQKHIINRYEQDWRGGLVDANSGFEPHSFNAETLKRWERFPLRYWRFGFDDMAEKTEAIEMMQLLSWHGYSGEKVRVYTLIGNEPVKTCLARIRMVIEAGFHPWPQRVRPLNWLGGKLPCRHDWTEEDLIAVQRFYASAALWKRLKPSEFYYQGRYPFRKLEMAT